MTPQRWSRIKEVFAVARETREEDRSAYLDSACGDDGELRAEVEHLLAKDDSPSLQPPQADFLESLAPQFAPGEMLAQYRVEAKLGQGGMGAVYRAFDTRLHREVALKVLPPEHFADPESKRRLLREARAASALNHPNIVTVHEVGSEGGVDFIAMEMVEGKSLDNVIPAQGLRLAEALDYAVQITGGLAMAHAAGIIHRDLKPGNIMVTGPASGHPGLVKLLDFGLAQRVRLAESETTLSVEGAIAGTPAYMSPEQAEGRSVDARSDVFSFGVVLYQMLTGRQAFSGDSTASVLAAVLREEPPPFGTKIPRDLEKVVARCLRKDPAQRFQQMDDVRLALARELSSCQADLAGVGLRGLVRRPRYALPAAALLVALVAGLVWSWLRYSSVRWVHEVALPQIEKLISHDDNFGAFVLAQKAMRLVPDDPAVQSWWREVSWEFTLVTPPPGAAIYIRGFYAPERPESWMFLGKSPLQKTRVPAFGHMTGRSSNGYVRWRIQKEGFETLEVSGYPRDFVLSPRGSSPKDMVLVGTRSVDIRCLPTAKVEDFWLDKYEVTNRQFKEFVDAGGYQKREYWKPPFVKDGHPMSWEQAMAEFKDATGRPSPATWELGSYKEGQAEFPVGGVSWYEAAAYAEFAGKSLPTVYHWFAATPSSDVAYEYTRTSNFDLAGPTKVGSRQDLGQYGTFDLAGNVREWCWNDAGGKRYILGGAWSEPRYLFLEPIAMPAWDRTVTNGFRCARYKAPLSEALAAPAPSACRDYSKEKPVADAVFQIYKSLYAYDRGELNAKVEGVDDSSEYWRREKVSFNAAYGNERVVAHLFLPKNASPPYQVVIHFPGVWALYTDSSDDLYLASEMVDFVIRSGRALVFPVLKDTFERRVKSGPSGPNAGREQSIQRSKDLGRTIDYLATRSDIDARKIAYQGLSWGASKGPVMTAVEERFRVSILVAGGLPNSHQPPELDAVNFAPRTRIPVLMLNGREDYVYPLETSQYPLFRLLGAPEKDKRHVVFDSGHTPPRQALIKETLDWLDKYLGPVQTK